MELQIHVPREKLSERKMLFQALFGDQVCGLLNDFNRRTLLVSSNGVTRRVVDFLRRELLLIPGAKFLNSKRFKETVVAGKSMWKPGRFLEGRAKNATDIPPDTRFFPPLRASNIKGCN